MRAGFALMPSAAFSLDLFADAMTQLVDDSQGGIRYWPGFVDAAKAQAWFDVLHANAAWAQQHEPCLAAHARPRHSQDQTAAGRAHQCGVSRPTKAIAALFGRTAWND